MLEFVVKTGADILLSDHYMARLDYLWAWMPGCVLNIHPGVTLPGHPYAFLGKTPTADAIERATNEAGVRTGATLHFVDGEIDHGAIIMFLDSTPVFGTDRPEALRYRNYQMAKLPVLIDGLISYLG
jgi:folate-dependent phosphoribosylglycinamide formyltransferase PurN